MVLYDVDVFLSKDNKGTQVERLGRRIAQEQRQRGQYPCFPTWRDLLLLIVIQNSGCTAG